MTETDRRAHWQNVYASKAENEVSWFQRNPSVSLELIKSTGIARTAPIVDVGGGASRLVDALLDDGFNSVTVLDISEKALAAARSRMGGREARVRWLVTDVTAWTPSEKYALWHDRAALHFLTEPEQRAAYVEVLSKAVESGGHVIVGTFALDGPERCSGLPVVRYDATALARLLGSGFELVENRAELHETPWGSTQQFQFSRFRKAL